MWTVDAGRFAVVGGLAVAVLLDRASIALLVAVGFLLGTGQTLVDTAQQSIVPALVSRDPGPAGARQRPPAGHPDRRQPARRAAGGRVPVLGGGVDPAGGRRRLLRGKLGADRHHRGAVRPPAHGTRCASGRRAGRATEPAGRDRRGAALAAGAPGAAHPRRHGRGDQPARGGPRRDPGAVRPGAARAGQCRVRVAADGVGGRRGARQRGRALVEPPPRRRHHPARRLRVRGRRDVRRRAHLEPLGRRRAPRRDRAGGHRLQRRRRLPAPGAHPRPPPRAGDQRLQAVQLRRGAARRPARRGRGPHLRPAGAVPARGRGRPLVALLCLPVVNRRSIAEARARAAG